MASKHYYAVENRVIEINKGSMCYETRRSAAPMVNYNCRCSFLNRNTFPVYKCSVDWRIHSIQGLCKYTTAEKNLHSMIPWACKFTIGEIKTKSTCWTERNEPSSRENAGRWDLGCVYTFRPRSRSRQSLTLCQWWLAPCREEWVWKSFCPSKCPLP